MAFTYETAYKWVWGRVGKFLTEDLPNRAVTDYGRYKNCANQEPEALAKVQRNYDTWNGGKKIDSGECDYFSRLTYGRLKNPTCKFDSGSPSVVKIGLYQTGAKSYGHNTVLVNASNTGWESQSTYQLDPSNLLAYRDWVVVDGWNAGMGFSWYGCVFPVDAKYLELWGTNIQVISGWNPTIENTMAGTALRARAGGLAALLANDTANSKQ